MLHLHTFALTDTGRHRHINEDNILAVSHEEKTVGLFAVADGMGGHSAGEYASQVVVDSLQETMSRYLALSLPLPLETAPWATSLRQTIQKANHTIYDYAQQYDKTVKIGSTVTCAFIQNGTATVANVGDSRTYLFRQGELQQLTQDHSFVEVLVQQGIIKPEERYTHPARGIVTRAIGPQPEVTVDIFTCSLQSGDRLLLCSDGLWEMLRGTEPMAQHFQAHTTLADIGQSLIEAANEAGGDDNISLVLVEVT